MRGLGNGRKSCGRQMNIPVVTTVINTEFQVPRSIRDLIEKNIPKWTGFLPYKMVPSRSLLTKSFFIIWIGKAHNWQPLPLLRQIIKNINHIPCASIIHTNNHVAVKVKITLINTITDHKTVCFEHVGSKARAPRDISFPT